MSTDSELKRIREHLGQFSLHVLLVFATGFIISPERAVVPVLGRDVLDRYNVSAGQKTEHYEIAAYGNVTSLAEELGYSEAADLLEENLCEEQDALEELSEVARRVTNCFQPAIPVRNRRSAN